MVRVLRPPSGRKTGMHGHGTHLRRAFAALTAGALIVGSLPATARATEPPFAVDLEVLTDRVVAAQIQIHQGGQRGLELLLVSAEFLEWRRQHPTAGALEAYDQVAARRDALDDARTPQDAVMTDAECVVRDVGALLADPSQGTAQAPHVVALVEAALGRSVAAFDTREDLVAGSLRETQWLRAQAAVEAAAWCGVRRQAPGAPR